MLFPEGASFASTEGPREAQALKKKKKKRTMEGALVYKWPRCLEGRPRVDPVKLLTGVTGRLLSSGCWVMLPRGLLGAHDSPWMLVPLQV